MINKWSLKYHTLQNVFLPFCTGATFVVLASAMRAVENGTEEAMGGRASPCVKGIVLTQRHSKCGMCT